MLGWGDNDMQVERYCEQLVRLICGRFPLRENMSFFLPESDNMEQKERTRHKDKLGKLTAYTVWSKSLGNQVNWYSNINIQNQKPKHWLEYKCYSYFFVPLWTFPATFFKQYVTSKAPSRKCIRLTIHQ